MKVTVSPEYEVVPLTGGPPRVFKEKVTVLPEAFAGELNVMLTVELTATPVALGAGVSDVAARLVEEDVVEEALG